MKWASQRGLAKPAVLVLAATRYSRNSLDEIEDACRQMPFLAQHRLDDPGAVGFAKTLVFEEYLPILVVAGHDGLSRRLHTCDEALGTGVCKTLQCRSDFVGEAVTCIFAVSDDNLLEALNAP